MRERVARWLRALATRIDGPPAVVVVARITMPLDDAERAAFKKWLMSPQARPGASSLRTGL